LSSTCQEKALDQVIDAYKELIVVAKHDKALRDIQQRRNRTQYRFKSKVEKLQNVIQQSQKSLELILTCFEKNHQLLEMKRQYEKVSDDRKMCNLPDDIWGLMDYYNTGGDCSTQLASLDARLLMIKFLLLSQPLVTNNQNYSLLSYRVMGDMIKIKKDDQGFLSDCITVLELIIQHDRLYTTVSNAVDDDSDRASKRRKVSNKGVDLEKTINDIMSVWREGKDKEEAIVMNSDLWLDNQLRLSLNDYQQLVGESNSDDFSSQVEALFADTGT
jgi:hypothetical protein